MTDSLSTSNLFYSFSGMRQSDNAQTATEPPRAETRSRRRVFFSLLSGVFGFESLTTAAEVLTAGELDAA